MCLFMNAFIYLAYKCFCGWRISPSVSFIFRLLFFLTIFSSQCSLARRSVHRRGSRSRARSRFRSGGRNSRARFHLCSSLEC